MSAPVAPPAALDTDVLVVGAGPTGLALALGLCRAGIRHLVVDKLDHGQNTSRAAVIHAHTLEVLERLGVAGTLAQRGMQVPRFRVRDRDRALLELRFDQLPSRHPYLLMLPQDVTEQVLEQALVAAGGGVRRGCTVESLTDDGDAVTATVATAAGRQQLRARYVVGADGMHSLVREMAGIGFAGAAYEESFVLADVDLDWPLGNGEVALFFAPAGLLVVAPLPNGSFRLVATLAAAPERPELADVQALLDTRGPRRRPGKVDRVHWSSRFRLHHRVADHYRRGRLLLVGDAAHVHSPAGGQGMNTGLVDACVLAALLADVLQGRRAETELDRYERLRRPAAQQVLRLAGGLTAMATVRGVGRRWLRNLRLRLLNLLPPARRRLTAHLAGLSRRAAAVID